MSATTGDKTPGQETRSGHVDRVVGPADLSVPEKLDELARSGRETPEVELGGEKIELREVEKTERDLAIIRLVTGSVDRLMRRYGRERVIEIPPENLHLIEPTEKISGFYDARRQQLAVEKRVGSDSALAADLFHELVHAKSYNALKVRDQGGDRELTYYRTGLETVARNGRTHFRELNEAVVQSLTVDFFDRTIARDDLFADEIRAGGRRGVDPREREEGSYWSERQHLRALAEAIFEAAARRQEGMDRRPRFSGPGDVEQVFVKASVTGQMLEAARLVEEVWGAGSFRRLGESLGEFCRDNIYGRRPSSGGLVDKLIGAAAKPVREIVRKCSSLLSSDSSVVDSLFSRLKKG